MSLAALSALAFTTFTGTPTYSVSAEEKEVPEVKNVIFMIGDGMGPSFTTAHRYMKDDDETEVMEPMVLDPYLVGMQTTYSSDAYYESDEEDDAKENIPDSAATATAMSSGVKTYNGAIAVDVKHEETETVLEAAKEKGKATGLVATSQINHATPAAYGTHDESRSNYDEIADDYYDDLINGQHKVDVLLGGGTDFFIRDDRNLTEEFQEDGYSYVTTRDELLNDSNEQVLGLFAPVGLDKMIDRPEEQPSLADMTTAALERLKQDEDGFFLMVEGSQIDWAAHDNDVVASMSEMEDFTAAFEEVIEFAEQDGETLVVTTADHSTGGFSIGRGSDYLWNTEYIDAAEKTPDYMAAQIEEGADIVQTLEENIGFDLTEEEIQSVVDAFENTPEEDGERQTEVDNAIEHIFNVRSGTGWTTDGHTGEDVQVYAYGPGSDMFAGLIDNTQNAINIFKILEHSTGTPDQGGELPDTATTFPLWMVVGMFSAALGGILVFRRRMNS